MADVTRCQEVGLTAAGHGPPQHQSSCDRSSRIALTRSNRPLPFIWANVPLRCENVPDSLQGVGSSIELGVVVVTDAGDEPHVAPDKERTPREVEDNSQQGTKHVPVFGAKDMTGCIFE